MTYSVLFRQVGDLLVAKPATGLANKNAIISDVMLNHDLMKLCENLNLNYSNHKIHGTLVFSFTTDDEALELYENMRVIYNQFTTDAHQDLFGL